MKIEKVGMHDFKTKLSQPGIRDKMTAYLNWLTGESLPIVSPVSINLDPTSACNFRCGHCIDKDILNTGKSLEYGMLQDSLGLMQERGLKSVILIGGGEPTLYKNFEDLVVFLKKSRTQVAIVTNGTNMQKIDNIGGYLNEKDWVRLSIDAGTDETFQRIHRPNTRISLDDICHQTKLTKQNHPNLQIGYSFVIASGMDGSVSNVEEMVLATQLAKDNLFSYISLKPELIRNSEDSEVLYIDSVNSEERRNLVQREYDKSKKLGDDKFKVIGTNSLIGFLRGEEEPSIMQKRCHLQFFRQALTPNGIFTCPGYRGKERFKVAESDGYSTKEKFKKTVMATAEKILSLDARKECRDSACLYKETNEYIEDKATKGDYFL